MKNNISIAERNALVTAHMHIVPTIARQYRNRYELREDLLQEGYLGLIIAAERFNPEQGVTFASYAAWWVRKYIIDALREYGHIIRIPQHCPDEHVYTEPLNRVIRIEDGEALTYEDVLTEVGTADQALLCQQQEDDFAARLARLTPRQLEILGLRYGLEGEPMSTAEIAKKLGISIHWVYKAIETSLQKIR